ncbi:cytochrome c [Phenylobacterium sp.]|uniref:cytochrome c n=1 Tax=Phenylobacterium sp. TaxID=1871053 RepID=UPI003568476E
MRSAVLALVTSLSLTGAAFAAGMTVKDEMKTVVDPATNTIFAVGGDVDPANGPDAAKVPAARWQEALKAAQSLKTAAADLTGPQKQPGAEWTKSAADFAKLAADAEKAAMKKDGAAFSTAANGLGDTCTACHSKYKPQSGD